MKPIEDSFRDWESNAFGYGYGTGERHVLMALSQFMFLCQRNGSYDFELLEAELTPAVAWLLINRLADVGILEYGTSTRCAWLTDEGKRLKDFIASRSVDELVELTVVTEEHTYCYPTACNCGPDGYERGRKCENPFWR